MTRAQYTRRAISVVLALASLASCVGWGDDLPGGSDRRVASAVHLHRGEDGDVWLVTPADSGRALTRQVVRVGWREDLVAVELTANGSRPGGWYVLDTAGTVTAGPLAAAPAAVRTFRADSAWARLGAGAPGV
jgi:hypothetical protein